MHRKKEQYLRILIISFAFFILSLVFCPAQQDENLEIGVDLSAITSPLPKIFKANIDLSGRGFNRDSGWPQTVASPEVLNVWSKDIGFRGMYRLQYNLWEIDQLSKDPDAQKRLKANYEELIKNVSDAGGIVILNIFGTPANLGRVLDKKAPPRDIRAFKQIVKGIIRDLSCNKRYNIWYEVWSAPDMDDFFLGRKQDYLNLYQAVGESANELEAETKIHIPVGGPGASWWFQNFDGNTIATPERSLVYELIKFCSHYRLPLDFITWHGYSTDPGVEKENTIYKKTSVTLVRDWLTYFGFEKNTPLIVDEWNFDRDANVLSARGEKSFIAASYLPSRIKSMYEAGIDYQLYYCLEDFQNNEEGVVRNVGVFSYDAEPSLNKGSPKAIYNAFKMLSSLQSNMLPVKIEDEFIGAIASKGEDHVSLIIYNYIDPDIVTNFLTKNIGTCSPAERKILLGIVNSTRLSDLLSHRIEVSSLRLTKRLRNLFKKALDSSERAKKFTEAARNANVSIKNLKDNYIYQRYAVDSSCASNCEFVPVEEKELSSQELYQETLSLKPYSLNLIVLKKKPKEVLPESPAVAVPTEVAPIEANTTSTAGNITNTGNLKE